MSTHVMERRVASVDRRASRTGSWASPMGFGEVQWRAVVAGAFAGFATTIVLTTLGAAIGITAGSASNGANGNAVGAGVAIWWAITVILTGVVAGMVIARASRPSPDYSATINGLLAWVIGATMLLVLLAMGVGSIMGGLGGGLGAAAAQRGMPSMSPSDSVRVAQTAANVGKGAAWGLFISQILGIVSTIMAARRPHEKRERATA